MTNRPYLSVVATARNDNHGGDLLYRMQIFVNGLVAQCERHGVDAELVLVEWNPPADRPPLAGALEWAQSDRCDVRIIDVPPELHATLEHSDRLPLFQMIAKNVGIRRARGEFVLATNVDVLLSDELMEFVAAKELRVGGFYRTDRYDVTRDIPLEASVAEQLKLCDERVIRVCSRDGTLDLRTGVFYRIYNDLSRIPWWMSLIAHAYWATRRRLRRVPRVAARVAREVGLVVQQVLALAATSGLGLAARILEASVRRFRGDPLAGGAHGRPGESPVRLHVLQIAAGLRARGVYYRTRIREIRAAWRWERARIRLHTNASGDFTLLAADDWSRVRAYPELELFSMHIDGLFLYQAHYAGLKERFLPHRVYHLEHASGFKPDEQGLRALNERLDREAIPQITNEQFMAWAMEMHEHKRPIMFNTPDWGFAGHDLAETRPANRTVAV